MCRHAELCQYTMSSWNILGVVYELRGQPSYMTVTWDYIEQWCCLIDISWVHQCILIWNIMRIQSRTISNLNDCLSHFIVFFFLFFFVFFYSCSYSEAPICSVGHFQMRFISGKALNIVLSWKFDKFWYFCSVGFKLFFLLSWHSYFSVRHLFFTKFA